MKIITLMLFVLGINPCFAQMGYHFTCKNPQITKFLGLTDYDFEMRTRTIRIIVPNRDVSIKEVEPNALNQCQKQCKKIYCHKFFEFKQNRECKLICMETKIKFTLPPEG